MKPKTILPIALDLGAKDTGVYAAAYPSGITLKDFSTDMVSKVAFTATSYSPDKGGYVLLQNGRTANRHMSRNRTRNRQAKKLFKIMLECLVGLNVKKHQEAIAHFLNRRGYSYVEGQVSSEDLAALTTDQLLPLMQVLIELGHEGIVEEFELTDPIEALRCVASQGAFQLEAIIEAFQKLPSKPRPSKPMLALRDSAKLYLKDLTGGAVHRIKYFENLAHDFNKLRKHPDRHCRRFFHALNDLKQAKHGYQKDDVLRLMCHVSNFDLKLLNRIVKALPEHPTETLLEEVLTEHVSKWILKQWALSESNGHARLQEIRELRTALKQHLTLKPNEIVSFLLDTSPEQTIPPYESHTNRRPPSCQTLLLSSKYLDDVYKGWRNWLSALIQVSPRQSEIQSYRKQLSTQLSNQGNPLITEDELDARTLQLILDTSKAIDPFKLNTIWSHLKDYHSRVRNEKGTSGVMQKLEEAFHNSVLPEALKQVNLAEAPQGGFWHFVNRYYQTRRRCRDGRYFIPIDKTHKSQHKRWQSDGKLLAMCSHRPKQIKHQGLQDMRVLLGLNQQQLPKEAVLCPEGQIDLGSYLLQVKGLKAVCDSAYKAQKQWGAELNDNLTTDVILKKLSEKIQEILPTLSQLLQLDKSSSAAFIERNQSIYQFAQLYQMAWGDRSGFASTCPVCATDNAVRMADNSGKAQAVRLSTLSMRLIDGGLKRHLNHQAHHIANRIWDQLLKHALLKGSKVTIPLILEQNRFDFAENLHMLKGTLKNNGNSAPDQFQPKVDRIKEASKGVCPYNKKSKKLVDDGDVDHIIPRSGRYGTLNDEANLIYASVSGNRKIKGNRELTLDDLNDDYLQHQFNTKDTAGIQHIIEQRLKGEREDIFSFGRYRQFRALTPENQVAFRHALFLPADHPLRALVISTLQHRRKTRVNGTQRFMAQLLADTLWQKAKELGKQGNLSFDYFEVSSDPNNEASTVALRRHLESSTLSGGFDLQPFVKQMNQPQQSYSHVIDATLAFMLSVQSHQNEGGMRIKLAEDETIWSNVDEDGVYLNTAFEKVAVLPEQVSEPVEVKPRATHTKVKQLLDGVKPHQVISRRVFKQNALGLEFYDFQDIEGKLFRGWVSVDNGQAEFVKHAGDKSKPADKNANKLQRLVELGLFRLQRIQGLPIYRANKQAVLGYIFDALSQAKATPQPKQEQSHLVSWLLGKGAGNLYYYTSSTELTLAPHVLKSKSVNPFKKQWDKFYTGWKHTIQQNSVNTEVKNNKEALVIASDEQANWQSYCEAFLEKASIQEINEVPQPKHTASRAFTMRAPGTPSGIPCLICKNSAEGTKSYHVMDLDSGVLGKEQAPALAIASPNVVLFDRNVLQKGYMADTAPKQVLEATEISAEVALNVRNCKEVDLNLETIKVVIEANKLHIMNIERQWFEKKLLLENEAVEKPWYEKTRLYCSGQKKSNGDHAVAADSLKKLLKRSAKHDKGMALKVGDEKVSVSLVLDKLVTKKILEEIFLD